MEVFSEDLDSKQNISNEESENELDMNKEYFFERIMNQNGGKIQ